MYKKIFLLLTAIILIFNFTLKDYADAAVASKAATLTAKKILKEVVQEASIETAVNFALLEAMQIAGDYEAKEGYKIVCPSGSATCDKPVQVKETLTDADKTAIKAQSEIELDKLISPDGKGFSKWQKFLDWFLPIWLVTFAMSALTYAIDSDFRSMINEAGYNALVALGIITPLQSTESIPLGEVETEPVDTTTDGEKPSGIHVITTPNTYVSQATIWKSIPNNNVMIDQVMLSPNNALKTVAVELPDGNLFSYEINGATFKFFSNQGTYLMDGTSTLTAYKNGQYVTHAFQQGTTQTFSVGNLFGTTVSSGISLDTVKLNSVRSRLPYQVGDHWYTDILFNTVSGNVYEFQLKSNGHKILNPMNKMTFTTIGSSSAVQVPHRAVVYTNEKPLKVILPPVYEDNAADVDMAASSVYENAEGNKIALIPPTAFPYKEESTGQTVYRVPSPTGEGAVFQKEDGTPVPEENVVPGDTPTVTKDPQGVPQYTPAPTPSNPAPAPTPLTPGEVTQPTPDGTAPPPPPPAEEPPLEPFPEGSKCEAKLQFPIFSPLKEQFSTSFPFSIPWDIGRAIEAGFGDIGQTKPEFSYDFELLGEVYPITISTPKLFDDWKPFTDSLLIFIFDVSIMFGIYRFVKGGGS